MALGYLNAVEEDALSRLLSGRVEFVIVGGHAVLHYTSPQRRHGEVRTIGDLDIFVEPVPANLNHLNQSMIGPGWMLGDAAFNPLETGVSVNIPRYHVQFLPKLSGVTWQEAHQHALSVYSRAGMVPVISRDLLIVNKRAAGRPKDLADVIALETDYAA